MTRAPGAFRPSSMGAPRQRRLGQCWVLQGAGRGWCQGKAVPGGEGVRGGREVLQALRGPRL